MTYVRCKVSSGWLVAMWLAMPPNTPSAVEGNARRRDDALARSDEPRRSSSCFKMCLMSSKASTPSRSQKVIVCVCV